MNEIDLSKITTYQAGAAQAAMHRVLQKECDRILQPFGITKMHWLIIGHVLDAGKAGARISDISKELGTTIPYVTTAMNLLVSKGYIVRFDNEEDGRSTLVRINGTKYQKKCQEIEAALRKGLRKSIYASIDPTEFRTYMKVMYQLKNVPRIS